MAIQEVGVANGLSITIDRDGKREVAASDDEVAQTEPQEWTDESRLLIVLQCRG